MDVVTKPDEMRYAGTGEEDDRLYRKVTWRILPLLISAYMINYLDRVNIGYAKLQMTEALGFSEVVFGMGAGILFVGYFLFEVPSNMLLERIGARKTLIRIMVLWGTAAVATAFVTTPAQFYAVRFLLGVCEAGFFPGVVLYLTYWYPPQRRGRIIAMLMAGGVAISVVAGPLSGATMKYLDGTHGLDGWQWLCLTQGLPAIALGVAAAFVVNNGPQSAAWLTDSERVRIAGNLRSGPQGTYGPAGARLLEVMRTPRLYALALVDFLILGASYALVFWVPTMIKSWGVSDVFHIGAYAAIPYAAGVAGMILIGRSSDKRRERRWHFMGALLLAALGLWLTTVTRSQIIPSLLALSLAVVGLTSAIPIFVTAITETLPQRLAAIGIPFITSIGILGGAASTAATGLINSRTGDPVYSVYLVIALCAIAGVLFLLTLRPMGQDSPQL